MPVNGSLSSTCSGCSQLGELLAQEGARSGYTEPVSEERAGKEHGLAPNPQGLAHLSSAPYCHLKRG